MTSFLITITAPFIILIIIALKYDQIVPPTHQFIKKALNNPSLSWVSKLDNNHKLAAALTLFSAIFLIQNIVWLATGNIDKSNLTEIHSQKIIDVHERTFRRKLRESNTLEFRTESGTYLSYQSAYPKYNKVEERIRNGTNFSFLVDTEENYIYEIIESDKKIISYEEICTYKNNNAFINIFINIFVVLGGTAYLVAPRVKQKIG